MGRMAVVAGAVVSVPVVVVAGWVAGRPAPEVRAEQLLEEQVAAWVDEEVRHADTLELRGYNPEWDFMRRTFLALSLVDDALAHPEREERDLWLVDEILASLIDDEQRYGQDHFLLPYAHDKAFQDPDGRSLFVDGEIALVAGARRLVREDEGAARILRERVAILDTAFARSPGLVPESYPDEAWLFCVTNALVALRMSDRLDGTDHAGLVASFVAAARERMTEPATGLLGSSYTWDGRMLEGPEGSSIWLVATNLLVLDPELARRQYEGARSGLCHQLLGFGWASEWGAGWRGGTDVDSGPIVPLVDASPSSSGFAILAAAAFRDGPTSRRLGRSLGVADLVVRLDPRLAALADNPMGDVIVLHGLTFGPLWQKLGAPRT